MVFNRVSGNVVTDRQIVIIYKVNKLEPANIHWTTSSIPVRVVDFDFLISLMPKGHYGLRMTVNSSNNFVKYY